MYMLIDIFSLHHCIYILRRYDLLFLQMKAWAKAQNINSSRDKTLNSLSIILLVAFHLQVWAKYKLFLCCYLTLCFLVAYWGIRVQITLSQYEFCLQLNVLSLWLISLSLGATGELIVYITIHSLLYGEIILFDSSLLWFFNLFNALSWLCYL